MTGPGLPTGAVATTERLSIRPPRAEDFDAFAPFFMSERAAFVGGGTEITLARAWRGFASQLGHWTLRGFGPLVMERLSDGAVIGSVAPWEPIDWPEKERGWTIWDPASEGRGFAREGAIAVRRHVFEDLGWDTTVSYIDPKNARSIALAESLGCLRDDAAATPGDEPCLVYRHPRPEETR